MLLAATSVGTMTTGDSEGVDLASGASATKPAPTMNSDLTSNLVKNSPGKLDSFCTYMATTSFGAIAIYISILKFVYPQAGTTTDTDPFWQMLPAALFLLAGLLCIYAYVPTGAQFTKKTQSLMLAYYRKTELERLYVAQAAASVFTTGIALGLSQVFGQGWTYSAYVAVAPVIVVSALIVIRDYRAPRPKRSKPPAKAATPAARGEEPDDSQFVALEIGK